MLIIILILSFTSIWAADYCKLCENGAHTMCQFKEGPAERCIDYRKVPVTSADKRYILDIHNDIRNHVASGQESKGALGNQPAAADMFLLEWDDELAEIAQRWADQCISVNDTRQHDTCKRTERFEVGQNIVTAITTDKDLPELSVLILNWYKQIAYIVPSDVDDFMGIWRGKYLIGQYTQLVWAKTRYVGCAASAFKETLHHPRYNIRFICNYGPAGNIVGQFVYQRGQPCSKCPHRLCDRMRPNLCAGTKKGANVKKEKNVILKKNKDKAPDSKHFPHLTTLSNMVEIVNSSRNISKFLHTSVLNLSETSETDITLINIVAFDDFDFITQGKDPKIFNFTSVTGLTVSNTRSLDVSSTYKETSFKNFNTVSSSNSTMQEDHPSHITSYSSTFATLTNKDNLNNIYTNTSIHTKNEMVFGNYSHISISPVSTENILDSIYTKDSTSQKQDNISYLLPNTTSWDKEDILKNFTYKVIFVSSIKLIIDDFFNQSMFYDSEETKKHAAEGKSTIDFTKNKCEREIELDGVVVSQECKDDSKHSVFTRRKSFNDHFERPKTVLVKGNDVILPGNRHFTKATGVWHNGHCKCAQFIRSSSTSLHSIYFLSFAILFTHTLAIYL